ncbi:MAG: response regulator [Pseudomonadota bacterium]
MIRVLIVDDKEENLYLLRALLQGHGYSTDEARHGAEALEKARQTLPDLIISDLLMPGMDGYTLLRHWKTDERLQTIPFIVYTATYTDPKDERLALAIGADAFIVKPIEPEPFMARIREVLEKKSRNEVRPAVAPEDHEMGLLKEYSEVLIHKLEQKVFQLEQANQALQEEIARRRQAEAELLKARKDWEDIFQATGHPTTILDPYGRILAANKKCIQVTGKPLEQLLNSNCHEVFQANGKCPEDCPMRDLLESGSTDRVEVEMEAMGGYYLVTCTPVLDQDGRIGKIIHVATDMTTRREIERELRNSEDRFRRIYDDAPVMMHSIDRNLVIRNVNKKWLETLGYERGEVVGNTIESFMTSESRVVLHDVIEEFWNVGEVRNTAYEYVKNDGTRLNVLLDSIAWDDPTWEKVSLSVVRDVTQQRLLQEQLLHAQKMEAIGTLAGGVAHDFNNVLHVVLGYTDLVLHDEALPEHCRSELRKVYDSARRGADLVQRLLTFSRKTEIKPRPLNLNRRIEELRKMLQRTLPRMIDIHLRLGDALAVINADPTQIDQILMNLAVNARDAMPDGGKLTIETANLFLSEDYARTHPDARAGVHVLLTVTDTGVGMDRQTVEHIFEPFYTTKGVGEGTGLGLAIVHGIVKHHGGHIGCYSEPGHGTTFKIYFPALTADEEPKEPVVKEMPPGGSETILLVDDEEYIRDLGSTILTNAGYTVITASDGVEALDIFKQRADEISLVILDVIMPKMGGEKSLQALLNLCSSVKVVVATGYSANGPTREALTAGAKGFVKKPYGIRQVLEVVRDVLDTD